MKKKQQTLLYINKRGYAPVIICKSCGHKITCKNCSSYLVEHLKNKKLLCHHCGHSILTKGLECPSCQNNDSHFIDYGAGIEKIFTEISKTFPLAKICLFSSDHIKSQDELEIKVKQIKDHEYDIIIASQPYRSRVSAEKKVKFVIEPMIKSLSKKGKLIVVHACGGDPANKIIKRVWPKEIPFPSLYPQIAKYIKSNLDKEKLKELKFHKAKKFKYMLRALPNEISGGIATSVIFSAWNAAVYVNQITDEQIFAAERSKNYQKVVQKIVNKYKGLYFNNELFVIERK